MTLSIGCILVLVGGTLHFTKWPKVAELGRIAFFVGLFFLVWHAGDVGLRLK